MRSILLVGTVIILLLSGCASQQQLDDMERAYSNPHECGGELDVSHEYTIYTNDEDEKTGPTVVSKCLPLDIDSSSDYEKMIHEKLRNK